MLTPPVDLLLLCAEEDAKRFEQHLMESGLRNRIRTVHSADDVMGVLEGSSAHRTALVVVDPVVEGGWEVIRWLKTSSYRRVPLLVICDQDECEEAYHLGANGILGRGRWKHHAGGAASVVGNFWMKVARLPPIPQRAASPSWQ